MSKREIAAAAAKKYALSPDNATANPPADRYHSVITLITLGKAEEGSETRPGWASPMAPTGSARGDPSCAGPYSY